MSPDPLAGDISDPQSLNRYSYVRQKPLDLIDPLGLSTLVCHYERITFKIGDLLSNAGVTSGPSADNEESDSQDDGWVLVCESADGHVGTAGAAAAGGTGGGGGNGGGGGATGGGGFLNTAKNAVCSALPAGKSIGVSAGYGGLLATGGSAELVVNYTTAQVSGFASFSTQAGWNGVASVSATTSYLYGNLGADNRGYSNGFTTVAASKPLGATQASIGVFASKSSGGPSNPVPTAGGVSAFGLNVGVAMLGRFGGGAGTSQYSQPLQMGKYWGFSLGDWAVYGLRKAVCQ